MNTSSDSELRITHSEAGNRFDQLLTEIADREATLAPELPTREDANISARLRETATNLASGQRTARAVPAVNLYAERTEKKVRDALVDALVGLDVVVNAADDIIDIDTLDTEQAVVVTANALFGHTMLFGDADIADALTERLPEYYTKLAQIPHVEAEIQDSLEQATSSEERVDLAASLYEYDAVDIDAFGTVPGSALGLDPERTRRLCAELRTFRARHLLLEDLRHVERTQRQGDTNPVLYLLRSLSPSQATAEITAVLERFSYSDDNPDVDLLATLERRPADLQSMVTRAARQV